MPGLSLPEQMARLSVGTSAPEASAPRVEVAPAVRVTPACCVHLRRRSDWAFHAQMHLSREHTAAAPSREEALTAALAAAHEQAARATARALAAEAEAARADASRAAMAGTVDALSRHNSRLAAEVDALMGELAASKASNASLQSGLDAADAELSRLKAEFEEAMKRSVAAAAPTPMPQRRRRDADAARSRGNQCFKEKRWEEAAAEYSAGLAAAASVPDMETVRAVLHSNRAAVLHAQGRFLDAASDCSAALALDPNFTKARVRRADMLSSMGDFDACVKDLEELLAAADGSDEADLAGWRAKLADARAKLRVHGGVVDHYAVLGLAPDASVAAVKAAFRSLALKHHPDKAPPELGAPLKCAQEQLFKLLSNAHATLTDLAKRQRFDAHREQVAKKLSTAGAA